MVSLQKSCSSLNNKHWTNPRYQKGRRFWALPCKIRHWFACTRCSSVCVPAAPNVQIQIRCHVKYVESLSQLLRVAFAVTSAGSKLRTTTFCGLRLNSKLVNSNVPHLRSLVSGSCIEIIVQVKRVEFCFQLKQAHDCSVVSVLRTRSDYKLGHLNSRSSNGEIRLTVRSGRKKVANLFPPWVRSYSFRFERWLQQFFNNFSYHISEPIIGRFPQTLCSYVRFTSEQFHWFIQLRKETLQHFARFWRLFRSVMLSRSILVPLFPLYLSLSLSLFFSFLNL